MFNGLRGRPYGAGVAVSVTNACPLQCKHCITNSSPKGEQAPDHFPDDLARFLDRNDFETNHVTMTGGEPFHDLPKLIKLVQLAAKKGYEVGAITSSFWAKSPERAADVLSQLPGLRNLTLSVDAHHEKFVPQRFVRNAFAAAKAKGLVVKVRVCVQIPQTADDDRLLEFVKSFADASEIESQQIVPYGRSAEHSEFSEQMFAEQNECPAIGPHLFYNGDVIPCCNTIVPLRGNHPLRITRSENDESLQEAVLQNMLFVTLKTWGAQDLKDYLYPDATKNITACDLCADVCTDSKLAQRANEYLQSPQHRVRTYTFALLHMDIPLAEKYLKVALQELIEKNTPDVPEERAAFKSPH
ncbi:radical SAM protein [Rhizobium sp. CNPSo 3490]|uniref:radical SAM protein n=1 Tax=Rhizobium sp. CNPSo 3490 TaxID=3021407 RepID=UPI00254C9DAD|nr:radical SAM protein [Rhizobium sp. CNPSo 3490]MDK4733529.1 radical SAM protein [Rhizobium sp. CNPSo 3490]